MCCLGHLVMGLRRGPPGPLSQDRSKAANKAEINHRRGNTVGSPDAAARGLTDEAS